MSSMCMLNRSEVTYRRRTEDGIFSFTRGGREEMYRKWVFVDRPAPTPQRTRQEAIDCTKTARASRCADVRPLA